MQNEIIFISYRRDDTSGYARAIYEHLVHHLGKSVVFMDVEILAPGVDFTEQIRKELALTKLMLVLIGPDWVGKRVDKQARLFDDNDFVRLEILIGLTANIPIIPIMVGTAEMPAESDIPNEIKPLLSLQTAQVTHKRFIADMEPILLMCTCAIGMDTAWHKTKRRMLQVKQWLKTDLGKIRALLAALAVLMGTIITFVPSWYLWPPFDHLNILWSEELSLFVKLYLTINSISPFCWVTICLFTQFTMILVSALSKGWKPTSLHRSIKITAITQYALLFYGTTSSVRIYMTSFREYPDQSRVTLIALSLLIALIGLATWLFRFSKKLNSNFPNPDETRYKPQF